jgi:predicted SAM-dependent methyltransferase
VRLNLGCSTQLLPGFVNVDIVQPCDEQVDLSRTWPWPDSSVGYIRAWDIIEHLPDKIHTMNEAHRVLVPGGIIEIKVPTTDGPGAWQDPQHCSYWNRNSFWYFTKGIAEYDRFHKSYGITACFEVVSDSKKVWPSGVVDLTIVMWAVK